MSLSNVNLSEAAQRVGYRHGRKPMHDYLLLNAAEVPDQVAYVFYGRELSWREVADSAKRLAGYLRAQGIGTGDGAGLYLHNSPQYIIAHSAIQTLGAIITPLNPQSQAAELEHHVN